jgi:hypothetical protein
MGWKCEASPGTYNRKQSHFYVSIHVVKFIILPYIFLNTNNINLAQLYGILLKNDETFSKYETFILLLELVVLLRCVPKHHHAPTGRNVLTPQITTKALLPHPVAVYRTTQAR